MALSNEDVKSEVVQEIIRYVVHENFNHPEDIHINFHGGEPLLAITQIQEIVKGLEPLKNNKIYSFTTNAMLITPDILDFINKNTFIVSVSIDGTKASHDSARKNKEGKGTYDQVIESVHSILESCPNVIARMTVLKDNIWHLYEDVKHLAETGFTKINTQFNTEDRGWTAEDFLMAFEQLQRLIDHISINNAWNTDVSILSCAKQIKCKKCLLGERCVHIATDGTFYPCIPAVNNPKYKIGDLWRGKDLNRIQKLQMSFYGEVKSCKSCSRYNYCDGVRCKLVNKLTTGDAFCPDPLVCAFEKLCVRANDYWNKMRDTKSTYLPTL